MLDESWNRKTQAEKEREKDEWWSGKVWKNPPSPELGKKLLDGAFITTNEKITQKKFTTWPFLAPRFALVPQLFHNFNSSSTAPETNTRINKKADPFPSNATNCKLQIQQLNIRGFQTHMWKPQAASGEDGKAVKVMISKKRKPVQPKEVNSTTPPNNKRKKNKRRGNRKKRVMKPQLCPSMT